MIAFHLFWRPVYRYGIFYGVTFLSGYLFLEYVAKKDWIQTYPRLQNLLTKGLDSFVLLIILAILVWWRLGHVFLYDRAYYSQHLGEIAKTWQGGMSFIGWVIGVVIMLFAILRYYKLSRQELFLLGDLILCIVPLGILLGRVGNYLNAELYGLVVYNTATLSSLSPWIIATIRDGILFVSDPVYSFLWTIGLLKEYWTTQHLAGEMRLNIQLLQAVGEWLLLLIASQRIFRTQYIKKAVTPGRIVGIFFIGYAIVRFMAEYLKEIPDAEIYGPLTISQRIMLVFFAVGMFFVSQKNLLVFWK